MIARSSVDVTVRDELVFRCVPLTGALELEDGGRRFGSDMVTAVGLFDSLEAIAADLARW